jgi:hypothetical protein
MSQEEGMDNAGNHLSKSVVLVTFVVPIYIVVLVVLRRFDA